MASSSGASKGSETTYRTPEYFHCITDSRFRSNVYEPEADTFLLMEALDKDAARLAGHLLRDSPSTSTSSPARRRCCVEIGCGSGTILTHLGALLLHEATTTLADASNTRFPVFVAVDVNPIALEATTQTWTDTMTKFFPQLAQPSEDTPTHSLVQLLTTADNTSCDPFTEATQPPLRPVLHTVRGDLFSALPSSSSHATATAAAESQHTLCDVVLFNPPYVPTSMAELEATIKMEDIITAAWSGGPRGRVVLDRFLQQLPAWLARDGDCYIVLIKENNVEDVYAYIHQQFCEFHGVDANEEAVVRVEEVASRYTGEHLSIHRISYLAKD